ncbi:MAG: PepSY domain-containing protein [Opitutaceae bacterium]|nr:PepSY domain-containing protein [Opitutaceae bacterium]
MSTAPLNRRIWRWHFFAGLLVAPFAVFLAVTGAIYLWKPQYEEWRYRDLLQTSRSHTVSLSADSLLESARAALPGRAAILFVPATAPGRSVEVVFRGHAGEAKASVFVHPGDGKVLGIRKESDRLMTFVHDLHGSLLAGATGEVIVELAASWAFILVLTGLHLWWPRPFRAGGFLYPRFTHGSRVAWRDLHAVPAAWCAGLVLLLLATGMPWTRVSGTWIKQLAQWTGEWQPRETQASAHRSELLGGWSPYLADPAKASQAAEAASSEPASPQALSLDRVMAIAAEQRVTDAYAIALPQNSKGVYSILSDRNRAFTRTYLHLDQYSGKILADIRYKDFGRIAKFFTFGIILHEGQLFGPPNQIAGTFACLGIITMALSGVWLWWRRKPAGSLGAPKGTSPFPKWLLVAGGACAVLAPLLLASLLLITLVDVALGRRLAFLN